MSASLSDLSAILPLLPNVEDLRPRSGLMINLSVAFLVLTWIAVALRVYVRAGMIRSFGLDDWFMLLSLASFTSFCVILIVIANYSTSRAVTAAYSNREPIGIFSVLTEALEYVVIYNALYILTTILLKITLAVFFLRIIVIAWQRKLVYAAASAYTIYSLAFIFVVTFRCGNPPDLLVNALGGKCISNQALMPLVYISGVLNALTDWVYACLPAVILRHSSMPRRAKISAGILLSFGCVGSVASVIRIAYLGGLSVDDHFFRHALDAGLWSVVEPGLGITAASLSALRPLFRSMKDKTVFTRTKQTSNPDQKRITRSNVSYQDQKGFQLFENPDSWTRTMITTGTGRKNLSAINEMQDLEPVLPDTDSQNSQPGPLLERNVSQKSLVDRSTGGWTRVERAGVTVTRRFDISSSENMV